jgi:hypothetical protein
MTYGVVRMANTLNDAIWLGPEEGSKKIRRTAERMAANYVPNVLAQTTRAFDPVMMEARTILDDVLNRTPFSAPGQVPRKNYYNQTVHYPTGVGWNLANPFKQTTSRGKEDAAARKVAELTRALNDSISMPSANLSENVELSPAERNMLLDQIGKAAGPGGTQGQLNKLVESERFKNAPPFGQLDMIKRKMSRWATRGRRRLANRVPSIKTQLRIDKRNERNRIKGRALEPNVRTKGWLTQLMDSLFGPTELDP